ncbi:hypothetical protein [Mesotoga sp. BH458_6_3_2_1]|nr:hypothetical protein [Mesotoga sp. BH458_6_3_2_1]
MSAANLSTTLFLNGLSLPGVAGTGRTKCNLPPKVTGLRSRLT